VSRGLGGDAPATITILSGDVHTTYIAEIELGIKAGPSRVHQVVCSPFRNPLKPRERRVVRVSGSRIAAAIFATLARACRVPVPTARWRFVSARTFENSLGELSLDQRSANVTLFRSAQDADGRLTQACSVELAPREA
jgi:hypothetical protein